MPRKVFYTYNPETDNYERVFPSLVARLRSWLVPALVGAAIGLAVFLAIFYALESPTEKHLRHENSRLKANYNLLSKRLDNSLKIMEQIQNRDDNFYRVMMQMDPVSRAQRYAGLGNEERYAKLRSLSDADLIINATRQLDLLDRLLYAQSLSFDNLRTVANQQNDKMAHIPSVMPIHMRDYTMSSGYGYRRDPVYGSMKFHEGLDFAAPYGTDVFATAEGRVVTAGWEGAYGNCIDIDHGYNYLTRYAHLSKLNVKVGDKVTRGQHIGEVGSTGKSTGPHLHYEVRFKDQPQNPVNYYFMDLTPQQYNDMIELAENAGHVMD